MSQTKQISYSKKVQYVLIAIAMVLSVWMIAFSGIASFAESQAKVTASTANIRKEPSASSEALGSVSSGNTVSVTGQVTGSDGKTWYQVYVDANTTGYIRADLISITDGTTPSSVSAGDGSASASNAVSMDGVTVVNPISATISGGQSVRVREDASTSSTIVTTASNGLALTVTGTKSGADNKTWYLCEFINSGKSVTGYIRSDFVTLSGELVEASTATETPAETPAEPAEMPGTEESTPAPTPSKTYDTQLQGDSWYLLDYANGKQYNIENMFEDVATNAALYDQKFKEAKTFRTLMIVFLIVAVVAIAAAAFFLMKWRDLSDEVAMAEAERARKNRQMQRNGNSVRPSGDRKPGQGRPAGQGSRPAQGANGSRPSQGAANGSRPAQNPNGTRPAGSSAGTRTVQGTKPAAPTVPTAQNTAPVAAPAAAPLPTAPKPARTSVPANSASDKRSDWKSKNFTDSDDDEFEFGFLNWDGEDDK